MEAPERIEVVCTHKQSVEVVLADKQVHFKKYSSKGASLFKTFKKWTVKQKHGRYSFSYATKELALLEILYNFDKDYDRYGYEFVKKFVKKHKDWNISTWEKIMKSGKHHTSINRLYDIAKINNKPLAEELLLIIKKHSFILDT